MTYKFIEVTPMTLDPDTDYGGTYKVAVNIATIESIAPGQALENVPPNWEKPGAIIRFQLTPMDHMLYVREPYESLLSILNPTFN